MYALLSISYEYLILSVSSYSSDMVTRMVKPSRLDLAVLPHQSCVTTNQPRYPACSTIPAKTVLMPCDVGVDLCRNMERKQRALRGGP